jgi:hypothetical protein
VHLGTYDERLLAAVRRLKIPLARISAGRPRLDRMQ